MGITIHYRGTLKSEQDYLTVVGIGREFAKRKGVVVFELDVQQKELIRCKDGEVKCYQSPVRGILFCLHPSAEPIVLQFDSDNYLCESCKTQYAGISTHLEVLHFLQEIEPHFHNFNVFDEGEFWDTGDRELLEANFSQMDAAIDALGKALAEREDPSLDLPEIDENLN